jgi:DNA-binding transcriptional LysR family regulator
LVEEAMTKAGLSYEIGLEAGGWEAIKTYAAAGFGVAVVPTVCLTRDDRRRLDARDASKLFGKDSYGIIIRKGGALPRSARELIRLIDPGFPLERKEL